MVRHRSLGSLHRRLERRSRLTRPSHIKTGPVREGDATGPGQEFQVKNRGAGSSPRPDFKNYDFFSEHLLVLASHKPPAFSQSA